MADRNVIASLQAQIDSISSSSGQGASKERPARSKKTSLRTAQPDDERFGDAGEAFAKIVALLNVSDRSRRSLKERLVRDGFREGAVEDAMARAEEYGFIDDTRFGEQLVRSRISQGKGSSGIVRELAEHDIDAYDIPGWPHEFAVSPEEELDRALGLLKRKPPRSKNPRESAYRKLVQKGYPVSVAASAARMWYESVISF